jgi:hypothetical protein
MMIAERMVARQQVTFDMRTRTAMREHLVAWAEALQRREAAVAFHRGRAEAPRTPVDDENVSACPRLCAESPR